jgi:hypothetical protein
MKTHLQAELKYKYDTFHLFNIINLSIFRNKINSKTHEI